MAWTEESRKKALESKRKSGNTNQFSKGSKETHSEETKEKLRSKGLERKHSDESKQKISEKALLSTHRRLKKNTIMHNGILLDSTWEKKLAERLDELGISWIRPEPIKWKDDNNVYHNYFPDFYLTEHDIFLDPKNQYAYAVQKRKIEIISKQLPNLIILCSLKEINEFKLS